MQVLEANLQCNRCNRVVIVVGVVIIRQGHPQAKISQAPFGTPKGGLPCRQSTKLKASFKIRLFAVAACKRSLHFLYRKTLEASPNTVLPAVADENKGEGERQVRLSAVAGPGRLCVAG